MEKIFTMTILSFMISLVTAQGNEYDDNGLYFDGFLGGGISFANSLENKDYADYYDYKIGPSLFNMGAKIGSKFYLTPEAKFRVGLQIEWIRLGFSVGKVGDNTLWVTDETIAMFDVTPVNPGFASYLALNDVMGLEFNLGVGPGFSFGKEFIFVGFNANPQFKFRYRALALGLDMSFLNGTNFKYDNLGFSKNSYSLTIGVNL